MRQQNTNAAILTKVFRHTVKDCKLSLISLHGMFTMEGILRRLNFTQADSVPILDFVCFVWLSLSLT